jgi:hypothetical protein
MLPVEAGSLIGSIAGIAEIAKATFSGDGGSGPTAGRPPRVPRTGG